ncbi:MAG: hypothetical protein NZL92_10195 [Gloeomargarita sp. SKYG116]|nr:hypothetical protein [Gloeomargarita sp. SKYG116]MDW8402053.1 hypothetical protein [Gloeomargarita sp. SKYGB_i_bin116]
MLNALATVIGLGLAILLVLPWLQEWLRSPRYRLWGWTVSLASLAGVGVWWETGMTVPGVFASAGAFALGGLLSWHWLGPPDRNRAAFTQMFHQLLTGQRAWDEPTVKRLFRLAPPDELPRLQATIRYMHAHYPELRAVLAPFLESP